MIVSGFSEGSVIIKSFVINSWVVGSGEIEERLVVSVIRKRV